MIKATYDTVLVKRIDTHKIEKIILPDNVKNTMKSVEVEVVSVGPDYPYYIKKGDRIFITQYDTGTCEGIEVVIDDESYLSVKERWVLGKVVDDE